LGSANGYSPDMRRLNESTEANRMLKAGDFLLAEVEVGASTKLQGKKANYGEQVDFYNCKDTKFC